MVRRLVLPVYCRYWGVSCGRGLHSAGWPLFRKTPGSTFAIGANCRLLSKFQYNLHGLNRRCMFSTLRHTAALTIGDDFGASGLVIACADRIDIGDRVMCGANVTITDTDSHSLDYRQRHPEHFGIERRNWKEDVTTRPVRIQDDVFLGMNVLVLKGVTIGARTVVGAGSIVSSSLPPDVLATGAPARPVKSLA